MTRRLFTLIGLAVLAVTMGAFPAFAQSEVSDMSDVSDVSDVEDHEDPGISCTPETAAAGDEVECSAGPFVAASEVAVEASIGDDSFFSDDVTADSSGNVTFTFDVPDDAETGDVIDVTATGSVDASGTEGTAETTVDVDNDDLPETGGGAAAAGLATLMMGAYGLYRFAGRGLPFGS